MREKLLLLLLVLTAAAMWMSSAGKRASVFWTQARTTSVDLEDQRLTLAGRSSIDERAKTAVEQLVPSRTFDALQLRSEIDRILKAAGLTQAGTGEPQSLPAGPFTVHTIVYTVRNADYPSLVAFYEELQKRAPYIGLEGFSLNATPSNPNQLSASWTISSVEIARQ